jgi:glyoxylase-like metal-dependent hydrolase (beta-lactamase superfamily II)
MGDYMASLDRLLGRDDRVYYPGHGGQIDNPRRLVRGMMGHRKSREGAILRLLGKGDSAIDAMVLAMYVGLDSRLHPAAARSVLAHLLDLRKRGLVTGEEGAAWSIVA